MYTVPTYTAQIFIGVKDMNSPTGADIPPDYQKQIEKLCQDYVNNHTLCVTVTPTCFIYENGSEPGAIIGLINHPRFPVWSEKIREHAVTLAALLKAKFKQRRVSIVCTNETIMLGEKTDEN